MSLCCAYTLTSPPQTLSSSLLNYLILSTGGWSLTALSKEVAQLFRKKGSYHLLPIRLSAAPRTFAAWGKEHTENIQVTTVYSTHAITSFMCRGCLSTVFSFHTLVHLHTILCCSKYICSVCCLGISHQSTEKNPHPTSPKVENCRMQSFSWQLDHNFCGNILYWFWTTTHMNGSWFKPQS